MGTLGQACVHDLATNGPYRLRSGICAADGGNCGDGCLLQEAIATDGAVIIVGQWGSRMGDRTWVKQIGKQLREDLGDCPTLPAEMLELLRKLERLPLPDVHATEQRNRVKLPRRRERN